MALNVDELVTTMTGAAQGALSGSWSNVQSFVLPELHKMAVQLAAIEAGGFSPAISQKLLDMQKQSFEDVLIAMLDIALFQIEQAINTILKSVGKVVNDAVGFGLLPV